MQIIGDSCYFSNSMMSLTPAETYFLDSLILGRSKDLFQLVLKDLWVKQVIEVEERWILLHPRDRHERLRYFYLKGPEYARYQTNKRHEKFFLDLFDEHEELRFFEVRNHIEQKLEYDMDAYTRDYVYPDLEEAGCCDMLFFRTKNGKEYLTRVKFVLSELNNRLDHYLHHNLPGLESFLNELGSHILLLKKVSLDQLAQLTIKNPEIGGGCLQRIQDHLDLFTNYNEFLFKSFDVRAFKGSFDGRGGDYRGGGVEEDW